MHRSFWHRTTTLHWLLLSLIVWAGTASAQTAASGSVAKPARPAAQETAKPQSAATRKAATDPGVSLLGPAEVFTSPLLDNQQRTVKLESTNSKGDCPSGATKLESCSGVYANGTNWSITPCCKTVTE